MSSKAWGMVSFAKNTTVLCALVTLACECAVTGTAWDLLPCLPLLGGALAVLYATHALSPACKSYLNKQLSAKPWKGKGDGTTRTAPARPARTDPRTGHRVPATEEAAARARTRQVHRPDFGAETRRPGPPARGSLCSRRCCC